MKMYMRLMLFAACVSFVGSQIMCVPAGPEYRCYRCTSSCPGGLTCTDGYCLKEGESADSCKTAEGSTTEPTTNQEPAVEPKAEPADEPKAEPADEPKPEPVDEPVADAGTPEQIPEDAPCDPKEGSACMIGQGECVSTGTYVCDGNTLKCDAKVIPPTTELCDGLDNDCDGSIDEDFADKGKPCTNGQGECIAQGIFECGANNKLECNATPGTPTTELCNGKDDDCDGQIDNGFDVGKACTAGQGECVAQGKNICKNDKLECDAAVGTPKTETCNNKDDDCDGQIDDGITCACTNGMTRTCGVSAGECQTGTQTCTNGAWGACAGEVKPATEVCNGKDDNCNGVIDDGVVTPLCPLQKGVCKNVRQVCSSGKLLPCNYGPAYQATSETKCDGLDNDCDGSIDEGIKTTFYADTDKDGFGDPNNKKEACTVPAGFVPRAGDCYDKNLNARPGQTAFFGTHRGDNSFDYDCNGAEEKEDKKCSNCNGTKWKNKSNNKCGQNEPTTKCKKEFGQCINVNTGSATQKCH